MPAISRQRGTHDLLPDDAPAWKWLLDAHAAVAGSFGYRFIDTPIFEATELFARGVGEGTDVVDKEMYTFTDRGGRSLTLRPEGTAPVLRAVLEAHLEQQLRPVRVHYAMPMFRYDRPQAGRTRQFSQLGIESIGDADPSHDAEVVEVAWRFFESLALDGVSLQLNSLGDASDRARYRDALVAYYTPLQGQLCDDCRRRLHVNPLRLLDCKRDAGLVEAAPRIGDHVSDASRTHFDMVLRRLDGAGVTYTLNQRLVRGLDYYTHTAFEFWHESLHGAQNALGGGGRYDGLAEQLGYPATPGIGYALGVERILTAAQAQQLTPPAQPSAHVVIACMSSATEADSRTVASQLRHRTTVITDLSAHKLDRKLKDADRAGATLVVIAGLDEGMVLRNLRTRTQRVITVDSALDEVARELTDAAAEPVA